MDYALFTDEILARLLRTSDSQAFHEIYQRYWRRLFALALRKIGQKEIAEEIVQDVFETLWEKHASMIIENLESYLFSCIKYGVIRHYKSQIVEEKYFQYAQQNNADEEKTEELLLLNELHTSIEKALNLLPEKTQQVFRMSRFEHLSVKQISEKLTISDKAVEYHITQALKTLRTQLKDYLPFILLFIQL